MNPKIDAQQLKASALLAGLFADFQTAQIDRMVEAPDLESLQREQIGYQTVRNLMEFIYGEIEQITRAEQPEQPGIIDHRARPWGRVTFIDSTRDR